MLNKNLVKLVKSVLKTAPENQQYVYMQAGNLVVTDSKRLLVARTEEMELKDGSYTMLVDNNGCGSLQFVNDFRGPDYARVIPKELKPSVKLTVTKNPVSVLNMLISKTHSTDAVLYGIDTSFAKDFTDFAKSLKSDILVELANKATYPFILSCNENEYRYICMPFEYTL